MLFNLESRPIYLIKSERQKIHLCQLEEFRVHIRSINILSHTNYAFHITLQFEHSMVNLIVNLNHQIILFIYCACNALQKHSV